MQHRVSPRYHAAGAGEHDIHPEPLLLQPKARDNPSSHAISFPSSFVIPLHFARMRCGVRDGMTSTPPIVKLNIDYILPLTPAPADLRL
jgi:hypothetical protein